ncbi:MAG: hypothetical protein KC643_22525, partial [Nitrospira sp.]|nr:hypothetical protein [Nitrospira sp.]
AAITDQKTNQTLMRKKTSRLRGDYESCIMLGKNTLEDVNNLIDSSVINANGRVRLRVENF